MSYKAVDTSGLFNVCFWSLTAYKQDAPPDITSPTIYNCPTPFQLNNTHPSSDYNSYNASFAVLNTTTAPGKAYGFLNWSTLTATDDSGFEISGYVDSSPSQIEASLIGLPYGKYVVDYKATDASANTADCVFLTNVMDKEPPAFYCAQSTL